ncbi:MAG: NAD(P)/FAD-dependent oxidoreductase [Clostridia bacterium]|nr:NAD(P)/FAD-dependent oxidoreductase [Clostridia bacterium]MDD4386430.1 NAD(P)/FAD-dependent oxidoreductase [Clostridia bacterium]
MMNVIVIGAGAAGMMSAIVSAKDGNNVTILEKTSDVGNKLKITGKGRCNLTFEGDFEYFSRNITVNNKFMYSPFNKFSNKDTVDFFNNLGVKTKLERGNRIFLESDNADEAVLALKKELKRNNVKIEYNTRVKKIVVYEDKVKAVMLENDKEIVCDKCIIATGGKSYAKTGSSGDGYTLAKDLGHRIIDIKPGLVPIKSNDDICRMLQGLTLKNVEIKVIDTNKVIYTDFGEMLFAHFGLTGPIILSSSSKINRVKDLDIKIRDKKIYISIDLKPALSIEILDRRLQRDFEKYTNKEFKNCLSDLFPQKLIPYMIKESKIDENKKVHQITREERLNLCTLIKNLKVSIDELMSVEVGIVTCGGIATKEINPKTMESKLISGLYFAGEVIDLDGYTGGFNLQIAFSTGYVAGKNFNCED